MRNRRKLLVSILFVAGFIVMGHAFVQNVAINYTNGLALSLLGGIFWVCAE